MKAFDNISFRLFGVIAALALFTGCEDWTSTKAKDFSTDPYDGLLSAEAKEYYSAVAKWKETSHILSCILFDNADNGLGERDYLRCLPDSLDIVILENSPRPADIEDLELLHSKGTRVLLRLDFDSRMEELSDASALGSAIDTLLGVIAQDGLDGLSLTGEPLYTDPWRSEAAAIMARKCSEADDLLLLFEGDPLFFTSANREAIDLFVLPSRDCKKMSDVRSLLTRSTSYAGVPIDKLLLSSDYEGVIYDEDNVVQGMLSTISARVRPLGPLAGIAVYGAESDYYSADGNYPTIRGIINELN